LNTGYTAIRKRNKGLLWIIVYGIIIIVGYSIPKNVIDKISDIKFFPSFISDPLIHLITFGFFTLLLGWIFFRRNTGYFPYIKLLAYSIGFGFIIELFQLILPFRAFEFIDFIWDVVGILIAIGIIFVFDVITKNRVVKTL